MQIEIFIVKLYYGRGLIINMDFNTVITFLACIIFLFIFGKIFIIPLKSILKLVINSVLGGILIYIINLVGMNFGFHIGLNLLTAIIVGLLGVPGAALLVVLKIILRLKFIVWFLHKKAKFISNKTRGLSLCSISGT